MKAKNPSQQQLNNLLDLYQNKQFFEAEILAMHITKAFPKHKFAWQVLGAVLGTTGRKSEALDAYQTAVSLSPQDAETRNNLGNTLKALDRLDDAEASYNQAIALKPDFVEAHYNLGNTLKALGKLDEAEASYNQAIALKPNFAKAHNNLGNTLKSLGRLDEALAIFNQAIALKPDFVEAHSNLGITLNAMGLRESALKHFERSLQLKRGINPVNLYHKSFRHISIAKLDHDIEQFHYIAASGIGIKKFQELAMLYQTVKLEINHTLETDILHLSDKHQRLLGDTFNRP